MPVKTFQNHYLVKRELERGACGRTYLVEDLNYQNQPTFVLQELQPNYGSCKSPLQKELLWQEGKKLFDKEVAALQKISRCSYCVPPVEDYFTENYHFLIVQEQLEGNALSTMLQPGVRWNQQDTIELLIGILDALDFCHQEGVIHRDLNPNHVWRCQNGKWSLINFGVLQEINQLTLVDGRPVSKSVIGTEGYLPIEQLAGATVFASDIHAVGAIGMQALTGLHPQEIAFDHERGIPAWQQVPDCYVTEAFAEVLNRMLADLASDRYPNAGEALAALKAVLRDVPLASGSLQLPVNPSSPLTQDPITTQVLTFESAKLHYLPEPQGGKISGWLVDEISGWLGTTESRSDRASSGWLGTSGRGDRPTHQWQVKKSLGTAEYFVENLGNEVQLEMVYIPGDDFIMGAPDHEAGSSDNERPQHTVSIPAFYMGRYPVSQEQYLAVMGQNPACRQGGKLPIENVSWHDARQFCQKLSALTGRQYRLPSEAMWEYACRSGTSTPFHYGETITTDVANFNGNYPYGETPKGQYRQQTTVIDRFAANNFGLCDMHGNVWEWCEDHWYSNYEKVPTDGTAAIKPHADVNNPRVLRGGSWFRNSTVCRAASRHRYNADFQFNDIGFRVVHLLAVNGEP